MMIYSNKLLFPSLVLVSLNLSNEFNLNPYAFFFAELAFKKFVMAKMMDKNSISFLLFSISLDASWTALMLGRICSTSCLNFDLKCHAFNLCCNLGTSFNAR